MKRILQPCPKVISGQEQEISMTDFETPESHKLGSGAYGQVIKVRHKQNRKMYALKMIQKNLLERLNAQSSHDFVQVLNREISIMYQLNHPYIIKLYNHFEDQECCYLLLEYCPNGHLFSYINKKRQLDQRTAAQFLKEISSAIHYMHSLDPPIIHRDIKPENILLDSKNRAKLCDFGWSNMFTEMEKRLTQVGTPEYMAPELINREVHGCSVDI